MHQTRKGQQWYFGMKIHIGVDSQTGLAHSAVVTAANVHDKHPLPELLHGAEQRVYGDSAYVSQKELIASKAPQAKDFTNQRVRNRSGEVDQTRRTKNRNKSLPLDRRVLHGLCRTVGAMDLVCHPGGPNHRARERRRRQRAPLSAYKRQCAVHRGRASVGSHRARQCRRSVRPCCRAQFGQAEGNRSKGARHHDVRYPVLVQSVGPFPT
ncbi:hypothetical protein LMG28138_05595 [Pararobbsia alpina]|uniref:Transposase IS4-like domain-containing protein n=1 Tax=Pararobbsia alpina TaxID=621374 RepID=A0A6S7BLS9_9BURK|nr:hypothetical protein LMG28138_05595 [Pararobbsia alpina]